MRLTAWSLELAWTCWGRCSSADNPDGSHLLTLLNYLCAGHFFFSSPKELPILRSRHYLSISRLLSLAGGNKWRANSLIGVKFFRVCGPRTKSVYLFYCSLDSRVLSTTGVTFVLAVDFLYWARFISYVHVGDNVEVRSARGGMHRYSKHGCHFKIWGARRMVWGKFRTEDPPQILGVTLQNCRPATRDLYTLEWKIRVQSTCEIMFGRRFIRIRLRWKLCCIFM